jgi:hypothetical protein
MDDPYEPHQNIRAVKYNLPSNIGIEMKGEAGLWAMGYLLVTLEANYFVLTMQSNRSQLINELTKNVVDP